MQTPSCSDMQASASATVIVNVTASNETPNASRRQSIDVQNTTTKAEVFASVATSITTAQVHDGTQERNSQGSCKNPDKTSPLSRSNSNRIDPRSTRNSLKPLEIYELNVNKKDSSPKVRKNVQRKNEVSEEIRPCESVSANDCNQATSNAVLKRTETQGSLDDRFGSMFDIHRSAQYNVFQEITIFQKVRELCARVAKSSSFINFTMVVILINTITMAMEHYEQPESLDDFLEISNIVFISIFALEMLIKLFGEGFRVYVSQWFNIFDGFIVMISIIEVIVLRGGGGLSVLRSIRLLRIFRLIRPIRHQLIVMVHTMASVVTFTALLFLFMFTFAVLGMNLFGGKMNLPVDCQTENVRSHFDTFSLAMVTIFQILTLEDWNVVMQNAMRSTTHWAAVYFIVLTMFGYYILFNLLVAILVEGFTNPVLLDPSEPDDRQEDLKGANETTTDWLALIKSAKEQPSVSSQSLPSSENEDDFEELANLETGSPQSERTSKTTFPAPLYHCGPAMRGAIGKPNHLQNMLQKPDNSFNITRHSINPSRSCRSKDENITKNKVLTSTIIKPKPMFVPKGNDLDRPSLRKPRPRLNHFWSRNNNGFSCDDTRNSAEISKPTIVITDVDEPVGITKVKDDIADTAITPCNQQKTLNPDCSKSLFIFDRNNKLRQLTIKISTSKWFDYFILFVIVVSCVFMVLDQPHQNTSVQQNDIVFTASVVFTIIFTVEVVIKVIAQGLVLGKDTYLRLGWNILDFIIVIISWLHVITISFQSTSPGILGSVKVLRALRTLRPLRMIRRAPGLKLVVGALLRSLKPIGNTVLIAGIFFVVFGILGVQLFKGTFYHCDADSTVLTKQECLDRGIGKWVNRPYNFDNLAQALVTLFVLATRDGWVTVMHHGVDAVGIHRQPKPNQNEWRVCYFISFLMLVGFLVLNMVVGIIVNNYQLCQEKQEKAEKKVKQQQSKDTLEIADETHRKLPADVHSSPCRRRCYRLCNNKYWDIAIAFVICVNVILMSMEHYKMSENYELFLEVNNYICTGIFIIEAFVKLAAFGCRGYFQDKWNILDFLVVLFSVAGIIMDLIHIAVQIYVKPTVVRGLRVLRIIRVLKLFKVAKGVRSLLDTITKSLPQVANLGILLLLLFFIYSSLGIQLFGSIECSGQYSCNGLDEHAHFRDFQTTMLTLFRVATGDNWSTIFMDTLRADCDSSISCEKNCCFSRYVAPVYFTTFVLATHFVLLNVLVAVLMKDLKASREKLAAVLTHETIDKHVLKLTLSATKFVKEKAFSRKHSSESEAGKRIELTKMRSTLGIPQHQINELPEVRNSKPSNTLSSL